VGEADEGVSVRKLSATLQLEVGFGRHGNWARSGVWVTMLVRRRFFVLGGLGSITTGGKAGAGLFIYLCLVFDKVRSSPRDM